MADISQIIDRIRQIEAKREVLVALLDQPEIGTLRIDVNQAIEELDDLVAEFQRTFGK
jgi:methyl-accepting chemotaxis protein